MSRILAQGFAQQQPHHQLPHSDQEEHDEHQFQLKMRRPKILSSRRRKDFQPRKNVGSSRVTAFGGMDLVAGAADWRRVKTCCGVVLENRELQALMMDLSEMSVCPEHKHSSHSSSSRQKSWSSSCGVAAEKKVEAVVMAMPTKTSALKKHQLYLNRALLNGDLQYASPISAVAAVETMEKAMKSPMTPSAAVSVGGGGATPTVLDLAKLAEFSKGLVQRVAESNKFSDNSSDSGYEELSSMMETTTDAVGELKKTVLGYPLTQQLPTNLNYKRSPARIHETNMFARKAAATGN